MGPTLCDGLHSVAVSRDVTEILLLSLIVHVQETPCTDAETRYTQARSVTALS